jgi:uncharacterized protein with PIN domain
MDKVCCEEAIKSNSIYWNPYNEVVQCHSCGQIYIMGVDLAKGDDFTVIKEKE